MHGHATNSSHVASLSNTGLQLLELCGLIQTTVTNYLAAHKPNDRTQGSLPPKPLFDYYRPLLAAEGMLTELASDPSSRVIEMALQQFAARALHPGAATRVLEILAEKGEQGCEIDEISERIGVERKELCKSNDMFLSSSLAWFGRECFK